MAGLPCGRGSRGDEERGWGSRETCRRDRCARASAYTPQYGVRRGRSRERHLACPRLRRRLHLVLDAEEALDRPEDAALLVGEAARLRLRVHVLTGRVELDPPVGEE